MILRVSNLRMTNIVEILMKPEEHLGGPRCNNRRLLEAYIHNAAHTF